MKVLTLSFGVLFALSSLAHAELDTVTYVDSSGGVANNAGHIPDGSVEGDTTGVGEVTLLDIDGGDMWDGGDQFIYLHDNTQHSLDWTATVRVVSQTEAVDGRWGKAGIHARSSLDGNASNAMAQLAAGNGSQVTPPAVGDHSPVPVRIGGRTQNDGNGGFETAILASPGTQQDVNANNEIANNTFQSTGTVPTWLSLSYTAATNEFVAGTALDIGGAPGIWSYSPPVSNVPADGDGWYVGLAYSAHPDLVPVAPTAPYHGVTFDNFSLSVIPEPSSIGLILVGALGMLGWGLRRRRRR
jgi:PEP-CTERM motif